MACYEELGKERTAVGKIHVLDKHVADLIAAGEVVERPASVIKELTENSIDAHSASITVEIRSGGVAFMRVADNGYGIAREDVPTAFLSHATSKVAGRKDLGSISTLGFRGEALPSIAAVAHVELITRTEDELAGTRYCIDGSGEKFCGDAGCAKGTSVTVQDLFYNTPARMKFLKKDVTEGNAASAVVQKEALAHPEISFRFLRDGRETLHTPGDGKIKPAVYAVFGKKFTSGLIPLNYELNGVKVSGFISKPEAARPNRSMQNFFINGRYVKSRTAAVALEESFKGSIMAGKFPACVLHISVPYEAVDVNVHPAKIEVRFLNEKPIFDAVYHGVKSALKTGDTPHIMKLADSAAPAFRSAGPQAEQLHFIPNASVQDFTHGKASGFEAPHPFIGSPAAKVGSYRAVPSAPDIECDDEDGIPLSAAGHLSDGGVANAEGTGDEQVQEKADGAAGQEQCSQKPEKQVKEPEKPEAPEKFVGEAFKTYIIIEQGDNLIFIDKHAAHERIIYEKLKVKGVKNDRQILIEPVSVTLAQNEYSAVLNSLGACAEAGFDIEDFGNGTVIVRSAPMILGGSSIAEAVMEIAGCLASCKSDLTTEKVDWLYHNIACRAAVKAGDHSSPEELMHIVHEVEQEDIRYCPHGRPVCYLLPRRELERKFGRTQ